MQPLIKKYVASFIRTGLAKGAGILTGIGIVTLNQSGAQESLAGPLTEIVSGLLLWGIAQGWSLLEKKAKS